MHLNSGLLFDKYALNYFRDNMNVLEIGPSAFPSYYCQSVNGKNIKWHTLDIKSAVAEVPASRNNGELEKNNLHYFSEHEYSYPIEDGTFDIVISCQVMEHVKNIWKWIDELKRITKRGGLLILIVPVSWLYHESPVDCWRIYPDGMKELMEDKGLVIKHCGFESLEKDLLPASVPTIPGNSKMSMDGKWNSAYTILIWFLRVPFLKKILKPVSVAYDTICIAQK